MLAIPNSENEIRRLLRHYWLRLQNETILKKNNLTASLKVNKCLPYDPATLFFIDSRGMKM